MFLTPTVETGLYLSMVLCTHTHLRTMLSTVKVSSDSLCSNTTRLVYLSDKYEWLVEDSKTCCFCLGKRMGSRKEDGPHAYYSDRAYIRVYKRLKDSEETMNSKSCLTYCAALFVP